ncbi:MAG TPA: type II toxin-antitoxin system HipA family toxin YjjJ, partial [Burkholderiaceae bacterium]
MAPTGHTLARERLSAWLHRHGPASAPDAARALGVSPATLLRMLQERPDVLAAGQARRRRYALRRSLRGEGEAWPVYAIGRDGRAELAGTLSLVAPEGSHLAWNEAAWPAPEEQRDGWWPGLPYPVVDMRPQGYMGRRFARRHAASLRIDPDPRRWSDEEALLAMLRAGSDLSGNLVVGREALAQWQQSRLAPPEAVAGEQRGARYVALAEQSLDEGEAGSSAGGEFPKFTARRIRPGAATPHVLVKFSGAEDSAAVRRWSDLLVCEHLALEALPAAGVPAARSEVLCHGGRTFLEVERFDRHGEHGRSPLVSLEAVDAAFVGTAAGRWPQAVEALQRTGLLTADDAARVRRQWWFGRLIRNTDMHPGNLSFEPEGARLRPSPAYDMLPMCHAPLPGGEVPERSFDAPLPAPEERDDWFAALPAALGF